MTFQQTLDKYQKMLESDAENDKHAALLFALQIPSIMSRMEFPRTESNTGPDGNGEPEKLYKADGTPRDSRLYRKWVRAYIKHFISLYWLTEMTPEDIASSIYELRNTFTHEGVLIVGKHIVFTDTNGSNLCLPHMVFVSVSDFCDMMFTAAHDSLAKMGKSPSEVSFTMPEDRYKEIFTRTCALYNQYAQSLPEDKSKLLRCYRPYMCIKDDNVFLSQLQNLSEEERNMIVQIRNELRALDTDCAAIINSYQ